MADELADKISGGLRVVGLLAEQGCDLSQERLVSHLFVGDAERLADLARDLFLRGFRVVRSAEDTCLAEAMSAVDAQWVQVATTEMMAAAADHCVEYDGWEAEADPPVLH